MNHTNMPWNCVVFVLLCELTRSTIYRSQQFDIWNEWIDCDDGGVPNVSSLTLTISGGLVINGTHFMFEHPQLMIFCFHLCTLFCELLLGNASSKYKLFAYTLHDMRDAEPSFAQVQNIMANAHSQTYQLVPDQPSAPGRPLLQSQWPSHAKVAPCSAVVWSRTSSSRIDIHPGD